MQPPNTLKMPCTYRTAFHQHTVNTRSSLKILWSTEIIRNYGLWKKSFCNTFYSGVNQPATGTAQTFNESLLRLLATVGNQCQAFHMFTHWAVQLTGKIFVLDAYGDIASSAFCNWCAVTAWKIAHESRQLGDAATIWLLKKWPGAKKQYLFYIQIQINLIPKVSAFRMFEEGLLQHTQHFRIYVDVLQGKPGNVT